mgnify:CR=1 FL=1
MENKTEQKKDLLELIQSFIARKKKLLIFTISFILVIIVVNLLYKSHQTNKNETISEKYIQAQLLLANKNNQNSYKLFREIILSKNKFYSFLALNNVIDSDLEKDKEEMLNLFKIANDIDMPKEQKDLFKFKKALFLLKSNRDAEAKQLLNELISENSIWKSNAIEILQ